MTRYFAILIVVYLAAKNVKKLFVRTVKVPNFIFDVVVIIIEIAEGMFIVKAVYPEEDLLAST